MTYLPLLHDPQLATFLLTRSFAPRAAYLCGLLRGDWEGGCPRTGQALYQYAAAIANATNLSHFPDGGRSFPAHAFGSIREGGLGFRIIASPAEHALVFARCQLRALTTIQDVLPALFSSLVASSAPCSFVGCYSSALKALPPSLLSAFPEPNALPSPGAKLVRSSEHLKDLIRKWRIRQALGNLSGAAKLAYRLTTSPGCIGGYFLQLYSTKPEHLFSAADWTTAVCHHLGLTPDGLSCYSATLANEVLVRSSRERLIPHNNLRDELHTTAELAGYQSQIEVTGLFGPSPSSAAAPPDTAHLSGIRPAEGVLTGALRRMDNVLTNISNGAKFLVDVCTPVGLSPARLRDWLASQTEYDSHLKQSERRKEINYSDIPPGTVLVAFVVGMYGEATPAAQSLLLKLGLSYARRLHPTLAPECGEIRAAAKQFSFDAMQRMSLGLVRGKIAQFSLARSILSKGPAAAAAGSR